VSGRYLSFSEREDIALYRAQGLGVREIARCLDRSPSTISRKLRQNASTPTFRLECKATIAQWHAERRGRRPKVAKLAGNERLPGYVQDRVSGRVRAADGRVLGPEGPEWKGKNNLIGVTGAGSTRRARSRLHGGCRSSSDDETTRISHEAIHQALSWAGMNTGGATPRRLGRL
jgi:hypothetical protein